MEIGWSPCSTWSRERTSTGCWPIIETYYIITFDHSYGPHKSFLTRIRFKMHSLRTQANWACVVEIALKKLKSFLQAYAQLTGVVCKCEHII